MLIPTRTGQYYVYRDSQSMIALNYIMIEFRPSKKNTCRATDKFNHPSTGFFLISRANKVKISSVVPWRALNYSANAVAGPFWSWRTAPEGMLTVARVSVFTANDAISCLSVSTNECAWKCHRNTKSCGTFATF